MKKTTTTTTTATATATANEYRNRYGLTAFQYGEKITADIGKLYLTAVNCAISATRIKRDLTHNDTIASWLDDVDSALKYAWNNIDSNGEIHLFDSNRRQDVEDAISDCLSALLTYDGEIYTQEIYKKVRNCYDKRLNDLTRTADSILTESLEKVVEDRREDEILPTATAVNFRNKELLKAIKSCDLDEITIYILTEIANGRPQTAIAEDLHISNVAVHKRYKKALESIRTAIDADSVRVAVNGRIYR